MGGRRETLHSQSSWAGELLAKECYWSQELREGADVYMDSQNSSRCNIPNPN